ncbi:MAG: hypothetical protein H6Q78_1519 [Candidatus Krumholzibacteriota bacterium]|nr:hypothetical protein [Candidatus Krumholzibacteriota bacterium]
MKGVRSKAVKHGGRQLRLVICLDSPPPPYIPHRCPVFTGFPWSLR